ncbi:MAG TPA: hypothetical protein P5550_11435 [Bacteroidales bacterium]|nr:hypothetical protein [Bacteroidales bacterium]HRZ76003.1 hypothetical protein [Bacteroidales bacterium]
MKTLKHIQIILLTALLAFACQRGPVFEEMKNLPQQNWIRFNTLWYSYTPSNHDDAYTLSLVVRYTDAVAFNKLLVMGTIHSPSGEMRFREYSLPLRDADGMADGSAVSATGVQPKVYEKRLVLREELVFTDPGEYRFEIENLMDKYDSPGIIAVGVVVEKE